MRNQRTSLFYAVPLLLAAGACGDAAHVCQEADGTACTQLSVASSTVAPLTQAKLSGWPFPFPGSGSGGSGKGFPFPIPGVGSGSGGSGGGIPGIPSIPGIPGEGGGSEGGIPGIPSIPGIPGEGSGSEGGIPGIPSIPGIPGEGGGSEGGIPGIPSIPGIPGGGTGGETGGGIPGIPGIPGGGGSGSGSTSGGGSAPTNPGTPGDPNSVVVPAPTNPNTVQPSPQPTPTPTPAPTNPNTPVTTPTCGNTNAWDPSWTSLEDQVLVLVNQRRAAGANCAGTTFAATGPLKANVELRSSARQHACDMGTNHYFAHNSQDGTTPWQRITATGYRYSTAAENIAAGVNTASAVVDMWMSDYGHCANIMNPSLQDLGTGFYTTPGADTYRYYWVQDFGTPQ